MKRKTQFCYAKEIQKKVGNSNYIDQEGDYNINNKNYSNFSNNLGIDRSDFYENQSKSNLSKSNTKEYCNDAFNNKTSSNFQNNYNRNYTDVNMQKNFVPPSKNTSKSRTKTLQKEQNPFDFSKNQIYSNFKLNISTDLYSHCNYFDIEEEEKTFSKVPEVKEFSSINKNFNNDNLNNLINSNNVNFNINTVPDNNILKVSIPKTVITFKGDTNNSTINKITCGVPSSSNYKRNFDYSLTNSNSNVNLMTSFFPSKKHTAANSNTTNNKCNNVSNNIGNNVTINNCNNASSNFPVKNEKKAQMIEEARLSISLNINKSASKFEYLDEYEIENLEEILQSGFDEEEINNQTKINDTNNRLLTFQNYDNANNINTVNNVSNNLQSSYDLAFPLNKIIRHNKLNPVQEKCFDLLYNTDMNSVITAPTGSGKTVLFEIAIARVIDKLFDKERNKFSTCNFKIVYLAPIKSLCQEKFMDWKLKFGQLPFSLSVIEATGDSDYINTSQLMSANLILSTPERWDIITRKWKDNPHLISSIELMLIDEVHLLNEDNRGATLEAIIARMKLLSTIPQFGKSPLRTFRTIALSATIPNLNELAEFMQVDLRRGMKNFGEEYRPVQIEKLVFGYNNAKNEYMFEKYLNYRLADLIVKYSDNRPSLVFCQTQKGTISAATQLMVDVGKLNYTSSKSMGNEDRLELVSIAQKIKDKNLSNLVKVGIAFHNAGLCGEDRQLVEENFKKGLLRVICTTSTLAIGVNLPARLVIIKSTYCYRGPKAGYNEYSKMEIDQMVGRAGRPQYDTKGIAIIMTEKSNVDRFIDLTSEKQEIESHLKDHIIEHINAEITQGTITDVDSAIKWLKNTFMYIRMKYHPEKFNIKKSFNMDIVKLIDEYLLKMSVKFFNDLKDVQLITVESDGIINSNEVVESKPLKTLPTKLGQKMCKNYVFFETLKNIVSITGNTEELILEVLSNSFEFSKYHSKMEDRKTLNQFNKEEASIKYKIKGPVDTANKKAFILLQAALSGFNIDQWELRRQQTEILNSSGRILNCMKEFFKIRNDAKGYINSILLKKALNQRMWSDSDLLMKQLPKIGEKIARNFIKSGITTFEKAVTENPRKLEYICGKNAPFGNVLIDLIKSIPSLEFKYEILKNFKNTFKFQMIFNLLFRKLTHQEDFDPYTMYHVVVVESLTNKIVFKKKLKPNYNNKNLFFNVPNLTGDKFPLQVYLICDKFFGFDRIHVINSADDKMGVVINQGVSCTGQVTLYQAFNNKMKNNLPQIHTNQEVMNIDEEIDEVIKLCQAEYEDKPKPQKKKNKKKEKENICNSNITSLIENMKNSDNNAKKGNSLQIVENSNIKNNQEESVNNINNFCANIMKSNKQFDCDQTSELLKTEVAPNRHISYIDSSNEKTASQFNFNKHNNNSREKVNVNPCPVNFELNLDFLDCYSYKDNNRKAVNDLGRNPNGNPHPTKKSSNSIFNFDDII